MSNEDIYEGAFKDLDEAHKLACVVYKALLASQPIVSEIALTKVLEWYCRDNPRPRMMSSRSAAATLLDITKHVWSDISDDVVGLTNRLFMLKGNIVDGY